MRRGRSFVLWILTAPLALFAMFAGVSQMAHAPRWGGLFVFGALQAIGGALFLLPVTAFWGALVLTPIMLSTAVMWLRTPGAAWHALLPLASILILALVGLARRPRPRYQEARS